MQAMSNFQSRKGIRVGLARPVVQGLICPLEVLEGLPFSRQSMIFAIHSLTVLCLPKCFLSRKPMTFLSIDKYTNISKDIPL